MARASVDSELGGSRRGRWRFQPSVWTFVAPVALAACVVVIVSIVQQAGWLHRHHTPRLVHRPKSSSTSGASTTGAAMLYRPKKGDTLTDIAVRFGISISRLQALNPKVPVAKALPTSRRIRLR